MTVDPTQALNPITVEVIGSAFSSIVEEMGEALIRASYSTNIKERRDCSTALTDAQGQMLCQAEHIPMHIGSFLSFVPQVLAHYAVQDIRPGDVFMGNDAYEGGGTHLPDIVIAAPIFVEDTLVAWAINTAHHSDFADRGHAHIWQEGLRIPPVRLYREGILQEDVQRLFLLNCQVPAERVSDLRAQIAANRIGLQRTEELCAKYGRDIVQRAGEELMDYAERKMRAGIAAMPDGTYAFNDLYDSESLVGEIELGVQVTIAGDEITLAFDSPPQVRAGINLVYTALLATVYYAVKAVVDPTILPNAGLARPIHVEAEEGTLLRCVLPAAVDARIGACQRVVDLVHGALSQVVPARVPAASNGSVHVAAFNGERADRSQWVYLETIGGGAGARPTKDGLDGVHMHMTNTSNLPVEALENEYPITLLRYELVDGSGGAGTHIGGMGLRRVYRIDAPCRVNIMGSRLISKPWGLAGGQPGASGVFRINGKEDVFDMGNANLEPGDIFEIVSPGAGGYGAPSGRSADRVSRDIREGRIDAGTAAATYPTPI
ncbi:MAG: hydantoinase B/oxoprolinase family protein [Pseudomonadota bacterium]|nr:hydantoinase B/oxoprolinase family protein [Pseudomonadota bacterium]